MKLELVSIETDTHSLDGLLYEPKGGATAGAVLIMQGNCKNFYTGPSRFLPPRLVRRGYACLAFNRRGHDVIVTHGREPGGGAFQRIREAIDDNVRAAAWVMNQGFGRPIVIGHSNGGMLAMRHCVDHPDTPALVLLSAHAGGPNLVPRISAAGLLAGDRLDEIAARARELVAAGRGRELIPLPGWWHAISPETFLDHLDDLPDGLELAPRIRCPVLYVRGDTESRHIYPAEDFAARAGGSCDVRIMPDCDHFCTGREEAVPELVATWFDTTPAGTVEPAFASAHEGARVR